MAKSKKAKTDRKKHNIVWRLVHGQLVNINFFRRHGWKIAVGVVMVIAYIFTKYQCQTRMVAIDKLNTELEIVKNQSITERSKYMGRIRESAMQDFVDSLKLDLKKQERPPFKISYSE